MCDCKIVAARLVCDRVRVPSTVIASTTALGTGVMSGGRGGYEGRMPSGSTSLTSTKSFTKRTIPVHTRSRRRCMQGTEYTRGGRADHETNSRIFIWDGHHTPEKGSAGYPAAPRTEPAARSAALGTARLSLCPGLRRAEESNQRQARVKGTRVYLLQAVTEGLWHYYQKRQQ